MGTAGLERFIRHRTGREITELSRKRSAAGLRLNDGAIDAAAVDSQQ